MVSTNTLMRGSIQAAGTVNIQCGTVQDLQGALTASRAHSFHNTPKLLGVQGELQNWLLWGLCPGEWPHTHRDTAPRSEQPQTLWAQSSWEPWHNRL